MKKLEDFIKKDKFTPDDNSLYTGIADFMLRATLIERINDLADRFYQLSKKSNVTDKFYQDAIKDFIRGLYEINADIDSEDRERICFYVEEIMDMVNLQSSGGQLNNFMYGFDPTLSSKDE